MDAVIVVMTYLDRRMQHKRLQLVSDTVKLKGMIMLNRCNFRCVLKVDKRSK